MERGCVPLRPEPLANRSGTITYPLIEISGYVIVGCGFLLSAKVSDELRRVCPIRYIKQWRGETMYHTAPLSPPAEGWIHRFIGDLRTGKDLN